MPSTKPLADLTFPERVNSLITNRVPGLALTRFRGWFSRIKNLPVFRASMVAWRWFVDDLLGDDEHADRYANRRFVTLRFK